MPPDYCAHPLGIASAVGSPTSLTLNLDAFISSRRYSFPEYCLARLLPALPRPGTDDEPSGIVGLRVRGIESQGKEIHLGLHGECGGPATVRLSLPAAATESWTSILQRLGSQHQAQGFRPVWSEPFLTPDERDFLTAYLSLTQAMKQAAPAGSALLRRVALFHTVAVFYRVRCWEDAGGWKIDACVSEPNADAHDRFVQRLCHPRWGFPMAVAHRFCWCGTSYSASQQGHTCSFYFDRHPAQDDDAEPVYLRIHTASEGRDLAERASTCRAVGADPAWIRKVFPRTATLTR